MSCDSSENVERVGVLSSPFAIIVFLNVVKDNIFKCVKQGPMYILLSTDKFVPTYFWEVFHMFKFFNPMKSLRYL